MCQADGEPAEPSQCTEKLESLGLSHLKSGWSDCHSTAEMQVVITLGATRSTNDKFTFVRTASVDDVHLVEVDVQHCEVRSLFPEPESKPCHVTVVESLAH